MKQQGVPRLPPGPTVGTWAREGRSSADEGLEVGGQFSEQLTGRWLWSSSFMAFEPQFSHLCLGFLSCFVLLCLDLKGHDVGPRDCPGLTVGVPAAVSCCFPRSGHSCVC